MGGVVGGSANRPVAWCAVVGLLILATVGIGCDRGPTRPTHVLLISIDSLRADRLSCYGNPRSTSPAIDRLATAGTRFAHAYSPSSWTLPSHATLLTGVSQRRHGAVQPKHRLPADLPRLASILKDAGYRTRGVYSGPFLDPFFGFGAGFDEYAWCGSYEQSKRLGKIEASHRDQTNPCLKRTFDAWARDVDDVPTFWFAHMWDVHFDYIPPSKYVRRFDPTYRRALDGRDIAGDGFPLNASPRDVAHLLARYDGEVRYADDTIHGLVEALEKAGVLDRTLVVVTSDHGDEFLEHGNKNHMRTVYVESVRVPLVLSGPGVPRQRVVDTPVGLQDVAPTILDLLGVPADGMDGTSLRALMSGRTQDHPPVLSVLYSPFRHDPRVQALAIRTRDGTVMLPGKGGHLWVTYAPDVDPLEQMPMPLRDRGREQEAVAILESLAIEALQPKRESEGLPEQVEGQLRALGYIE
jgi:arylsulfatase A-like enzyme